MWCRLKCDVDCILQNLNIAWMNKYKLMYAQPSTSMFVWTVESLLQTILCSAAMSTNPSSKCVQCHMFKLPEEFGMHWRRSNHGQKGDRLNRCLSCTTINKSQQKWKCIEDDLGRPPKQFATSPSQFVEDLRKYMSADKIDISLCVSLDEMALTDKDITNHLSSLVWKATGYRFMWATQHCFASYSGSCGLLYTDSILQCPWLSKNLNSSSINAPRPKDAWMIGTSNQP